MFMNRSNKLKIGIVGSFLLLAVFVLPVFSFAKHEKKIFVDDDSKAATQDGSVGRPFRTIGAAIKNSNSNTEIHVTAGVYRENIELPKGVELFGENRDRVIITAKDKSKPVVFMNKGTKINKVTLRGGNVGIRVRSKSDAKIIKVRIEGNKEDGIKISESDNTEKFLVVMSENIIRNNGGNGVLSEKRKLSVMDNDIENNGKDGLRFASGVRAFLKNNSFKNNDRAGAVFTLDNSEIFADDNSFRSNDRDGLEISGFGKTGKITLKDSTFSRNDRYGIARIARRKFAQSVWNGIVIQKDNNFLKNDKGNLSPIIQGN